MWQKLYLALIVLALAFSGCLPTDKTPAETAVDESGVERGENEINSRQEQNIQLAQSLVEQQEIMIFSPEDYDNNMVMIGESLKGLVEALLVNDMGEAGTFLQGLEEDGSAVSMEELQREVELLHPVEWRMVSYKPLDSEGAVVSFTYTMPDGAARRTKPFSVIRMGEQWFIHYNSFAASFHDMARHLIKDSINDDGTVME